MLVIVKNTFYIGGILLKNRKVRRYVDDVLFFCFQRKIKRKAHRCIRFSSAGRNRQLIDTVRIVLSKGFALLRHLSSELIDSISAFKPVKSVFNRVNTMIKTLNRRFCRN